MGKLNSDGELMWNTFLGGSGYEGLYAVGAGGAGNVHVAGYSAASWGTPVRPYTSGFDGLAAGLNSNGALLWNAFLGGSGDDFGQAIGIGQFGHVYVVGDSSATWGSPIRAYTSGADVFVVRIDEMSLHLPLVVK